jgi:hypothetical protein
MIGYVIGGLIGAGVVYAMASGTSSSAAAGQSAQQTALYTQAQAFDTAANQLGLSATQAQQAYAAGVSAGNLAAYAQQQGWTTNPANNSTPQVQGPGRGAQLIDRGEYDDELGHIYRCSETGAPVVIDAHGDPWMVQE